MMTTLLALLLHGGRHAHRHGFAPDDFLTHGAYIILGFVGGGALVLAVQKFRGRFK